MGDIVERLRVLKILDEVGSDNPLARDAADEITRLRIKAYLYDVHCHHRLDLRRDLADAKGNHPQPQSDSGIEAEIGSDGNHLKDKTND